VINAMGGISSLNKPGNRDKVEPMTYGFALP